MLARARARLTYANVVATLALFLALGGSSYAVSQITSKDVKNRSLKGGDIRKNSLTGTEINERKLRRVPSARQAQNALVASNAITSELSRSANTAGTADVAALAQNAQALAGQGVGSFERSSRVAFGRAPGAPAGSSGEQTLLSWPEMGVELRSSSGACGAGELQFAVRNTKASGPDVILAEDPGGSVPPNTTLQRCGPDDEWEGELTDSTGRSLFVDCFDAQGEIRCLGVRSEP